MMTMTYSVADASSSAGTGSQTEGMRFLQFWILPSQDGLENWVQQRQYTEADRRGRLLQIMGPAGADGLDLAQDARVLVSKLTSGDRASYGIAAARGGYLYTVDGELQLREESLAGGDAAKLAGPEDLELTASDDTELILIDVPLQFGPIGAWAA